MLQEVIQNFYHQILLQNLGDAVMRLEFFHFHFQNITQFLKAKKMKLGMNILLMVDYQK